MRLKVCHRTLYRYDRDVSGVVQILRLTPRSHEGQYVVRWRLEVSAESRLAAHEDAFGNIVSPFPAEGPLTELAVATEGGLETLDTRGVVHGRSSGVPEPVPAARRPARCGSGHSRMARSTSAPSRR